MGKKFDMGLPFMDV